MISKVIISHYENELFTTIFDYINVCKFRMKNLLILSLSFFILASCEVSQSENVYTPPNNKIKPIENLIYYTDVNSLEIIKTKIKEILMVNQNNIIMIEPEEISSFIDCGYMNNEIYDFNIKKNREVILDNSRIFDFFDRKKIEKIFTKNKLPNSISKFIFNFLSCKIFLENR